jgi:hypothetical protein
LRQFRANPAVVSSWYKVSSAIPKKLFSDSRENLAVLTAVRKPRVAGRLRLAAGGAGSAIKSITPASCNTDVPHNRLALFVRGSAGRSANSASSNAPSRSSFDDALISLGDASLLAK